jgi:hypothetical protein
MMQNFQFHENFYLRKNIFRRFLVTGLKSELPRASSFQILAL